MATTDLVLELAQPQLSWRQRIAEKRLPWLPMVVLLMMLVCAAFAHWLAPYDPTSLNVINSKQAPFESSEHLLGTDVLGRDMLSRLIYGARTTAQISVIALALGAVIGTVVGLVSGYWGGWIDALLMRITDAALGFPTILLALVVVVIMQPGPVAIILAVLLTVWARFARMIRGDVLTVKGYDFVTLARITGVKAPVILWRHIFPNVANTLMVVTSLMVGQIILLEAALSFLGLGLSPGAPAWGIMVAEGQEVILDVWWLSLFPGVAITVVVLAFNFFGDWLRDYLDPKLRRAR
ncbi:MAG: ABC transporter permease [Chloroflexi bacterium]|nr:ABC transporter permease [Chloroflexota bacterium]MYD46970.1 ABC transporter permease [Chloroflexota bacterium]